MTKLIFLLLLLILAGNCPAQNSDSIKRITLKAKITDVNKVVTSAYIHSVSDTGMFIMRTENPVYSNVDTRSLIMMKPEQINAVSFRRKNQTSRGLAYGALTGAVVGVFIGLVSYNPESDGFDFGAGASAAAGGIAGAVIGGLGGMLFSIGSHKYEINGERNNYIKMQMKINRRLTKKIKAV